MLFPARRMTRGAMGRPAEDVKRTSGGEPWERRVAFASESAVGERGDSVVGTVGRGGGRELGGESARHRDC